MSIPKRVHYCWLGQAEKRSEIQRCMLSWKKHLHDYEIIEWNESNTDLSSHPFVRNMYRSKKYAFATDYIRLVVLEKYGGIYLDTDVLVRKSFNDLLNHNFVIGFRYDCALGTAAFGAIAGSPILLGLRKLYDENVTDSVINNGVFTQYFLQNVDGFELNGKFQQLDNDVCVFPRECFEYPSFRKELGYSVHLVLNTWDPQKKRRSPIRQIAKFFLGDVLWGKLGHCRALRELRTNELYAIYKRHTRAKKTLFSDLLHWKQSRRVGRDSSCSENVEANDRLFRDQ